MRLLIITQKVDKNDDILGFFHRWILEFAKHFEQITVICLYKGEYDLPANVKVLSLGKEDGISRLAYIYRFYKYIFKYRKEYDSVFVHMNPEYIVLGGLFWKILRKNIYLWYNHGKGGIRARIAKIFSKKIFYTSPFAYMARFKKSKIMPVGIDTEIFKRNTNIEKKKLSVLSLGRISPVKKIDVLIDALTELDKRNIDFEANIYGNPTDKDGKYYRKVRDMARILENKKKVIFHDSIAHSNTPNIYNESDIFVNLTPSGSFDKTIVEAMACKCIPIVCNSDFKNIFSSIATQQLMFEENDSRELSHKIECILKLAQSDKRILQNIVRDIAKQHDLKELFNVVVGVIKGG